MTKVICLFNHKGGVSKTTTAFQLGWMIARKGHTVLLADFDPQCNLTGMIMGFQRSEDLESKYHEHNIKDGLAPAFESKPHEISAVSCIEVPQNDHLLLLPGHIGLAEYETTLGIAQELSGSLTTLRNLPGSIRYLLNKTASEYSAEFVIVDMSPSLGPLNQNLLTTSDFFIVPLHPDYFSSMALSSLASTLPRWKKWADTAYGTEVLREADYPFPRPRISFIGSIVQNYRVRKGVPTKAFGRWFDELGRGLQDILIPAMEEAGMVDIAQFTGAIGANPWEPLAKISDFNSLIALSQEHQVPVYELTSDHARQQGVVWNVTRRNRDEFHRIFSDLADKVLMLTR